MYSKFSQTFGPLRCCMTAMAGAVSFQSITISLAHISQGDILVYETVFYEDADFFIVVADENHRSRAPKLAVLVMAAAI